MRERASQVDVAWSNWMQILRHHNYIRDVSIGPRQSLRKTKKKGQSTRARTSANWGLVNWEEKEPRRRTRHNSVSQQRQGLSFII